MRLCESPAEFLDIVQRARVKLEQIDEKMRALKSMRLGDGGWGCCLSQSPWY